MRQQYHSRKHGDDKFVWNVNKLVKISENLLPVSVSLSDIKELNESFWYGDGDGNIPTCKSIAKHSRLIDETDLKYPVLMCPEGCMIDGMHRVCKAYIKGMSHIKAVKFETMPEPDYVNVDLEDLPYD